MRLAISVIVFLMVASGGLSLLHPWGDPRRERPGAAILAGSQVPGNVRAVLEGKCADCHSSQTHWPLYSSMAPVSWMVERDVMRGRAALDLSAWSGMRAEDRIAALTRIVAEVRTGEMPPRPYAFIHAAALDDSEKHLIADWAHAERKRLRGEASPPKETK